MQFDWLLYLNTFMPTPITEEEPIVTLVPDYLRDMANLVVQQDKRSVVCGFQASTLRAGGNKLHIEKEKKKDVLRSVSRLTLQTQQ